MPDQKPLKYPIHNMYVKIFPDILYNLESSYKKNIFGSLLSYVPFIVSFQKAEKMSTYDSTMELLINSLSSSATVLKKLGFKL